MKKRMIKLVGSKVAILGSDDYRSAAAALCEAPVEVINQVSPDITCVIAQNMDDVLPFMSQLPHGCPIQLVADVGGLTAAQKELAASDWEVIRELERQFLKGTPLNKAREKLRKQVDSEL